MRHFDKTKRKRFDDLLKNKTTKNTYRYVYHKEAKEYPSNPITPLYLLSRLLMEKLTKMLHGIS